MLSELIEKKLIKPEPRRKYIGASSIGNSCARALWYDFHDYEKIPFEPTTQRTFDVGKKLEDLVLQWLEDCGLAIERPHAENDYLKLIDKENINFQGHMDALLHLKQKTYIIEIKTAKNGSFNIFKKSGVKTWYERYYAQLQAYMGISGIHQAYIIALNKDTTKLHDELVLFDEIYFATLQLKAVMTMNKDLIPKKINESHLFYLCKMCEFRGVCHK